MLVCRQYASKLDGGKQNQLADPDLIKRKFGLNTPRICHITPILKDLHWLPIKYRNEFKIVLLTFKCLYGLERGSRATGVKQAILRLLNQIFVDII